VSAATVRVTALLSLRDELGFGTREVEFAGSTLRDLLRALPTRDGRTLDDLMTEGGELRGCYVVTVNGTRVKDVDRPLRTDDQVVTTQFFRAIAGG
jgi:molybdopterin converting factor small subunit